jgi:hypothetical protein
MHAKMKEIWDNHKEGYATLLFLDELNRADLAVQQEMMQLVLDKKINETELPDDIMIITAGNPENSEYGDYQVNVMNDALKDRFVWLEMEPEVEEWLKWANRKRKVEGEEMTMIHEDVINFIATNPELLHVPNTDEDVKATPRSWEAVSDIIRSNEDLGYPEHSTYTIIKGTVGSSASVAFRQFIEEKQNPMIKVEEIINKKGLTEEIKDKLYEETMPRISVLSNRVVRHIDKAPRLESWIKDAFYEYLNAIPKDSMVGVISDIMRNYADSIYEKLFNEERFLDLFHEADARTEGF